MAKPPQVHAMARTRRPATPPSMTFPRPEKIWFNRLAARRLVNAPIGFGSEIRPIVPQFVDSGMLEPQVADLTL